MVSQNLFLVSVWCNVYSIRSVFYCFDLARKKEIIEKLCTKSKGKQFGDFAVFLREIILQQFCYFLSQHVIHIISLYTALINSHLKVGKSKPLSHLCLKQWWCQLIRLIQFWPRKSSCLGALLFLGLHHWHHPQWSWQGFEMNDEDSLGPRPLLTTHNGLYLLYPIALKSGFHLKITENQKLLSVIS